MEANPLRNLDDEQLKKLVEWGKGDVHDIIRKVIRHGNLKKTEALIKDRTLSESTINELYRYQGELTAYDAILNLPDKAKKMIELNKKEKNNELRSKIKYNNG